jgi:hypothetical protein
MALAIVRKSHLEHNKHKYFRAVSENIKLGSYGPKRKHPLVTNYLDQHDVLPLPDNTKIEQPTTVKINFGRSNTANFETGIPFKVVSGNVQFNYQNAKEGNLVLVKLLIGNQLLLQLFNRDPQLTGLLSHMKRPRVVNQIWIAAEATLAETLQRSAGVTAGFNSGLQVIRFGVTAGGGHTTNIEISAGTVFAYGMMIPVFNKKLGRYTQLRTDQWGLG